MVGVGLRLFYHQDNASPPSSILTTLSLPDLSTEEGLRNLNDYLLDRSYVVGFQLSLADAQLFDKLEHRKLDNYVNIRRWYTHVKSREDEFKGLRTSGGGEDKGSGTRKVLQCCLQNEPCLLDSLVLCRRCIKLYFLIFKTRL